MKNWFTNLFLELNKWPQKVTIPRNVTPTCLKYKQLHLKLNHLNWKKLNGFYEGL